jgi:hypothetical protein
MSEVARPHERSAPRAAAAWLLGRSTGRGVLAALGGLALVQVVMAGWLLPRIGELHPAALDGSLLRMVDFVPLITPEAAWAIFDTYVPAVRPYVLGIYAADLVLPVTSSFFFAFLVGILLRRLDRTQSWWWMVLVPFFPLPFDWLENALAVTAITSYPESPLPLVVRIGGIVTAIKLTGPVVSLSLALGLGGMTLAPRLRGPRAGSDATKKTP